jgi:spore coat polysaccharide biosynthesis protein SpsF
MGSARFPGKMLAKLGGVPVLEWVLRRVKRASRVDLVLLATSTDSKDDILARFAEECGVEVFRGSEVDVLGRFTQAAHQSRADLVVRVCADNPFVDPGEIDRLVEYFETHPSDYACNHQDRLGSRYSDGFGAEIFKATLLETLNRSVINFHQREHVTLHLWENSKTYHLTAVAAPPELSFPELRFDVDRSEDLVFLNQLCSKGVTQEKSASEIIKIALQNLRDFLVGETKFVQGQ